MKRPIRFSRKPALPVKKFGIHVGLDKRISTEKHHFHINGNAYKENVMMINFARIIFVTSPVLPNQNVFFFLIINLI